MTTHAYPCLLGRVWARLLATRCGHGGQASTCSSLTRCACASLSLFLHLFLCLYVCMHMSMHAVPCVYKHAHSCDAITDNYMMHVHVCIHECAHTDSLTLFPVIQVLTRVESHTHTHYCHTHYCHKHNCHSHYCHTHHCHTHYCHTHNCHTPSHKTFPTKPH